MKPSWRADELRLKLQGARRALYRAHLLRALSRGLDFAAPAFACGAVAGASTMVMARMAGGAYGQYQALSVAVPAAVAVASGALPLLWVYVGALRRRPSIRETAERLDLAARDHNALATALELLNADAQTPLARAAVDDARRRIDAIVKHKPAEDRVRWRAGRNLLLGLAGAACLAAASWVNLPPGVTMAVGHEPAATLGDNRLPGAEAVARVDTATGASDPMTAAATESGAMAESDDPSGQKAGGVAAGGTGGRSGPGKPVGGLAGKAQQDRPADRGPQQDQAAARQVRSSGAAAGMGSDAGNRSGAMGGSGRSSQKMISVTASGQGHENAGSQTDDDHAADQDVPSQDAAQENPHHGARQPMLQDRRQAPTRELGIGSAGKGTPGDGRGGPSEQKKSRGVGSLVIGVPLPDFIPGAMLPGASRRQREDTPPIAMPGERAAESAARAGRGSDEPPVGMPETGRDMRRLLNDYFDALHQAQEMPGQSTKELNP